MTSAETRLRETLHRAADVPMDSIDFDQLARCHRRQRRNRLVAAGTFIAAIVASVVWAAGTGSPNASNARLIPAAPSTPPASPRVEGISTPIVVAENSVRLDPAGPPPPTTASYQRLLAADQGRVLSGPVRVVYGKFSTFDSGHGIGGAFNGGGHAPDLGPGLRVWIIHQGPTGTVYTVVDPVTARWTISWAIGYRMPLAVPTLNPPSASAMSTVFGRIPPCYGPGANMNLMPVAVIEAAQGGRVVASKSFRVSDQHDSYQLTLKPGIYVISIRGIPRTQRTVYVGAEHPTHFDLPNLGCV